MRHLSILSVIFLAIPLSVHAFTADNRLKVADLGGGVFEAWSRGAAGARDYWCAAADYAFSRGAPGNARVYLVSGRQPSVTAPGRTAVRFTLDPQAAGITPITPTISLNVSAVGDNLSVASGREYCRIVVSRP